MIVHDQCGWCTFDDFRKTRQIHRVGLCIDIFMPVLNQTSAASDCRSKKIFDR